MQHPGAELPRAPVEVLAQTVLRGGPGEHPLDATLSQYSPGDTISVEVLRDGDTVTLSVTLGTRPSSF